MASVSSSACGVSAATSSVPSAASSAPPSTRWQTGSLRGTRGDALLLADVLGDTLAIAAGVVAHGHPLPTAAAHRQPLEELEERRPFPRWAGAALGAERLGIGA